MHDSNPLSVTGKAIQNVIGTKREERNKKNQGRHKDCKGLALKMARLVWTHIQVNSNQWDLQMRVRQLLMD